MGVDFCMVAGEPIRAVGDGVVIGIFPDWFEHQPYVWYQLIDGPYAGRFVYVAEQINRIARVGSYLSAGQPVAYYKRSGTCIETGWASEKGSTLAHITSGYREGQITPAGVAFARFLMPMGVHGPFELTATTRRKTL
jgi:murein DD-endopeptidase MepM/ murein hydrolase activator NlpD